MFPPDSEPARRVKGQHNGYYAIMDILTDAHPNFIEHPITLCQDWPRQKNGQTIFDFHTEFIEAICLRAIFMHDTQDLNSPLMLSTFIHNCKHSAYLLQVSRIDRQDSSSAHFFNPGTITITLITYLNNVDSPTRRVSAPATVATASTNLRFGDGSTGYCRPFQRNHRVHALEQDELPDDQTSSDLASFVFEPYLDQIVCKLAGDGPELRHCMFCGPNEMHLFDKCPILNDKRFSSTLAICLGSTYQRTVKEAVQRQKETRSGQPPSSFNKPGSERRRPPRTDHHAARIHQMFGVDDTVSPEESSHPDFLSPDFIPGQGSDFPQG